MRKTLSPQKNLPADYCQALKDAPVKLVNGHKSADDIMEEAGLHLEAGKGLLKALGINDFRDDLHPEDVRNICHAAYLLIQDADALAFAAFSRAQEEAKS